MHQRTKQTLIKKKKNLYFRTSCQIWLLNGLEDIVWILQTADITNINLAQ